MMLLVKLIALLLVVSYSSLVLGQAGITVDPLVNLTLPITSEENNTYVCSVTGNRQAIWEINNRQISGQAARDDFSDIGVFVSGTLGSTTTQLILTQRGRDTYVALNQSRIAIRCTAFDNERPVTEFGDFIFINIYGAPNAPLNFNLNPDPNELSILTLSWNSPIGTFENVPINYTISISGPRVNRNDTVTSTTYQFTDAEDQTCEEHTFTVFATNPAGRGAVISMEQTIPISPNILATNSSFRLGAVNLAGDSVSFEASFQLGSTCSDSNFPIMNYSVVIHQASPSGSEIEEVGRKTYNVTMGEPILMPAVIDLLQLMQQQQYNVSIEACINITCRNTSSITLNTSDVQQASLTFFENNIFMTCSFADGVTSQGCVFKLTLANGTELFYLARDTSESMASQCNVSSSQRGAYVSFEVMDWKSDGTFGSFQIRIPDPSVIEVEADYTQLTGCVVERPGLSGGAIAGIVLAILAFVVIAIAIALTVGVVVYKIKTGEWFKLKHKDDEKITVDFEKGLLMDEEQQKQNNMSSLKRVLSLGKANKVPTKLESKRVTIETVGSDSPDGEAEQPPPVDSMAPHMGITINTAAAMVNSQPSQSLSLAAQPLKSLDLSINPTAAFTMDIIDDKKVRLHLNKALIRQVLKANNINLDRRGRRRPRGQRIPEGLESLPLLSLAMTSEVRAIPESPSHDVIHEGGDHATMAQGEATGTNL